MAQNSEQSDKGRMTNRQGNIRTRSIRGQATKDRQEAEKQLYTTLHNFTLYTMVCNAAKALERPNIYIYYQ
jgi:hypothetical protein